MAISINGVTVAGIGKRQSSMYMKNDCCTENDHVYQSAIDNNVWPPSGYPDGWTENLRRPHARGSHRREHMTCITRVST